MISNATPLILLGKINQLELLQKTVGVVLIPNAVKKEVLIETKPGVHAIQEALRRKGIIVSNPKVILNLTLGAGENAAISLAKERGDTLLIDDIRAITAAHTYAVPTLRTTSIIFMALKKKFLTADQAILYLNQIITEGYYIKPAEYALLLSKLKNL